MEINAYNFSDDNACNQIIAKASFGKYFEA